MTRLPANWLARVDAHLSGTSWDGTWEAMRSLMRRSAAQKAGGVLSSEPAAPAAAGVTRSAPVAPATVEPAAAPSVAAPGAATGALNV